jgi:hypothetical protein
MNDMAEYDYHKPEVVLIFLQKQYFALKKIYSIHLFFYSIQIQHKGSG